MKDSACSRLKPYLASNAIVDCQIGNIPMGFEVKLYPHSHNLGVEVLEVKNGRNSWRLRLSQSLSGINPDTPEAGQSIMCVARHIN